MPTPEKFKETLEKSQLSQDIIDEMYYGFCDLKSKTNKKIKAAFFKQALEVMNKKLSQEKVKEILEANACCKSGIREKNSKEFARINKNFDILDRLNLINSRPYLYMGRAEIDGNGTLIVHAVSYKPEDKFECACPTVSKIKRDYSIPREYCYCCGGHFKYHYEIMLDVKLKLIEIISSPHDTDGEKPCVFRYEIISKE